MFLETKFNHQAAARRASGWWTLLSTVAGIFSAGLLCCCVVSSGCADRNELNRNNHGKHKDMSAQLTKADLEQIKAAAIQYYEHSNNQFRSAFIAELRRGVIRADKTIARIGIWVIQEREKKLELVRQPPPSEVMYYFGLHLRRLEHGWFIEGDFEERETTDQ